MEGIQGPLFRKGQDRVEDMVVTEGMTALEEAVGMGPTGVTGLQEAPEAPEAQVAQAVQAVQAVQV